MLDRAYSEVCAARNDDDAVFVPRHSVWINNSALFRLIRNRDELRTVPGIVDLTMGAGGKLQWGVMKLLRGLGDNSKLLSTLSRRICYFGFDRPDDRAAVFVRNMFRISGAVKPFVLSSVLRTVCNAQPTARRFRGGGCHSACRLGCSAVEGDSITHYPFCPLVVDFIRSVSGGDRLLDHLWICNWSLSHFLLLEEVHLEDLVRTALWCDIIFFSVNSRRSGTVWSRSTARDSLRARLRTVISRVSGARTAILG